MGGRRIIIVTALVAAAILSMGVRRSGRGGCLGGGRLLQVEVGGSTSPDLSAPDRTRTSSELELGPFSPFDSVRWRGDSSSYVDIFDVPILGFDDDGSFVDGNEFGNVVRVYYPFGVTSSNILAVDPAVVAAAANLPLGWDGGRALRMYDRGECSAAISWRDIGESFADGLDREIVPGIQAEGVDAIPSGNWTITPIIRDEFRGTRDRLRMFRRYEVQTLGIHLALVSVTFEGRFEAQGGRLQFDLLSLSVTGTGPEADGVVPALREALSAELEASITEGLQAAVGQSVPEEARVIRHRRARTSSVSIESRRSSPSVPACPIRA